MKTYIIESEDALWDFDVYQAYSEHGDQYLVYLTYTIETFKPVYIYRSNGDMDGFEGWGCIE